MAPSKRSGGGGEAETKKKKSTEATKTTKTVATKNRSRSSNGVAKELKQSSSTESQTRKKDDQKGAKIANQRTTPSKLKPKPKVVTKSKPNSKAQPKARSKAKGGKEKDDDVEEGSSVCAFPMNRIKVIIRSGVAADSRITQEAIFLINKASEKFIETMCEEAYISNKNYFGYKHISSLVGSERRYDFLSDFVPKRIKAVDALAETQAAEAST